MRNLNRKSLSRCALKLRRKSVRFKSYVSRAKTVKNSVSTI